MTKRFRFVAEITLTVDDVGTQGAFYFGTSGFTTKPTDTPANTVVEEWLEDPGTLRRELFSGARISGPVRPSFGQIVLTNHSGVLDDWIGYGISGGRVVVRYGEEGAAYPAGYATVYIAYAYSLIVDFDRVRVVLRDRLEKLEEPIVNDVFSGGGGLEGTGIAKKKKQMVFGQPGFVPPVPINAQRQIYYVQSNAADERCFRGTNAPLYLVFEGGRGLDFEGYYLTEADLFDGAPPSAGAFKVWAPDVDGATPESTESAGPLYFRLGSPPEYELRFNSLGLLKVSPTAFARRWRFTDLCQRAGVPVTMAAGSYVKSAGNYLVDGDQTYLDVMADACAATFSAFGFTRLDELFTVDLRDPSEGSDSSVFTFDLHNSRDIRRQPVPGGERPVYQVAVSVGRTWPTSSLRTSLDAAERELFERSPWQSTFTGTSAAVQAANRNGAVAATVEIQGNELTDLSSKFQFVRRYIYLYGARRELITLTTQLTAETMAIDLHAKVMVRMPRFGCDAGRLFRVVTVDLNCRARTVTFGLWGGPPGPNDTQLGGGAVSPGGGTGQVVIASGAGLLDEFQSIFYGRNIGGGGGGESTLAEFGQFAYGRNLGVLEAKWDSATVSSPHVLSDSDRRLTQPTSNTSIAKTVRATRGITSGKWYWEIHVVSAWTASGGTSGIGIVDSTFNPATTNLFNGTTAHSMGYWKNGSFWRNGSAFAGAIGNWEAGTIVAFAFDADAGDLWVGVKTSGAPGPITWLVRAPVNTPAPGGTGYSTSETYYPAACPWSSSPTEAVILDIRGLGNSDQPPPSGFTAYSA